MLVKYPGNCSDLFYINSQNCLVHSQTKKKVSVQTGSSLFTDNQGCIQILHDIEGKLNTGSKCLALGATLQEAQCNSSNGNEMQFVIERGQ